MHMDYDELYGDEAQVESRIEEIKGTISEDKCPRCGATIKYDRSAGCFHCDNCNLILQEDLFYRIYLGYNQFNGEGF